VTAPRREYLGSLAAWNERQRIYRTADALEVDASNRYEIVRRRVFYDEVLLATLHREPGGGPGPWRLLVVALGLGLIGLAFGEAPEWRTGIWVTAGLFGLAGLAGLVLPSWIVTVFGKRARVQIRYRLREAKARSVYEDLCRAAAAAQAPAALEAGPPPLPEPPAPGHPVPPPPSLGYSEPGEDG
jgi:hypothetical protein